DISRCCVTPGGKGNPDPWKKPPSTAWTTAIATSIAQLSTIFCACSLSTWFCVTVKCCDISINGLVSPSEATDDSVDRLKTSAGTLGAPGKDRTVKAVDATLILSAAAVTASHICFQVSWLHPNCCWIIWLYIRFLLC